MDQCTHEVRAEYWKGIIKACGQRPVGQSAKNWMDENGICEQSYYHWQRKFRQKAYEEMQKNSDAVPAAAEKAELSFVEIPYCPPAKKNRPMISGSTVAVIGTSALKIEITNDISDSLLSLIIREASNA